MRVFLSAAAVAAASLALVGPAGADVAPSSPAPIVVGHFAFTLEFPNDTNTCGFEVHEVLEASGSFRFFEADDGPFANIAHQNVTFTFSRNGKTVILRRHFTDTFQAVRTNRGLFVHISVLGGGLVVRDAGLFVQDPTQGVMLVRGPHPILEAGGTSAALAAICAELA
jgi:hypothetical protein